MNELGLRDKHDRERLDTILKQTARIEALEAALATCRELREYDRKTIGHLPPPIAQATISALCEKTDKQRIRIEALEAALLHLIEELEDTHGTRAMLTVARAALAKSSD